ncbi:methyl-accepting chemotaxis protein [Agrobacterium vitis]|uniref:methyl-accepting chemotaxis protein n=1 Tax=Agrobacterium vitis TaxID=373 RepID=UPI0038F76DCD
MKITAYGFAAVLFSAVAIGGSAWYRQSASTVDTLSREANADLAFVENDMAAQRKSAAAIAVALAGEPDMADLVLRNARESIVARYAGAMPSIVKDGGITVVTMVNANGEAVARIHAPDKFGDDMKGRRKTIVQALQSGSLVSGIEPGRAAVSMFASAPILKEGVVVGVVDAGTSLTNEYFTSVAKRIGGEIAVYVTAEGKLVKQSSTSANDILPLESLNEALAGKTVRADVTIEDRHFIVDARPLTNFSGTTIGVLQIASDVTAVVDKASEALWVTVIGTVVVSVLSLLGFLVFARSLASVIGGITSTMTRLSQGDLAAEINGGGRPDEVGAMARAVQVFKDNAIKTRELEDEAERHRNRTEEERLQAEEKERERSEAMAFATSGLASGLRHLAAGDLSFQISESFHHDFESLRSDFNQAVGQLRATLSSVSEATSAIDSGSREISRSADDLSRRTEQQAASLEETAAALDEITVNVSNSSKRAEEARAVAVQANENARRSGTVVGNAVDAMSKIEQSSSQISNIIGVIDEIAFQTNLLALNAGVEAARAGEAGRGFAVVAQEVRELAQRSAKAAKEIKELIRNSSGEVETGVHLVRQTGDALRTIETYIVTINQHMDSIATSSKEQSVGLAEVNTAVNQMDQVTQQNAAMVEEANAAGATLAMEAGRLKELVAQFRFSSASTDSVERKTSPAAPRAVHSPSSGHHPRLVVGKPNIGFAGRSSAAARQPSVDSWEEF